MLPEVPACALLQVASLQAFTVIVPVRSPVASVAAAGSPKLKAPLAGATWIAGSVKVFALSLTCR